MGTVSVQRVSTTGVPTAERLEFWQATVSASLRPVLLTPAQAFGREFQAEFLRVDAGAAKITRGLVDPVRSVQTPALARQQSGNLIVTLQESGRTGLESRSGAIVVPARSVLIQSDDEPVVHTHLDRTGMVLLSVDADRLSLPTTSLREHMNVALPVDAMLRAVVLGAAETARHAGRTMDATGMEAYLTGVVELVLRTVTGRAEDHASSAGVRRQQVHDTVLARYSDPHLTVGVVAEKLGVSVRRLHQLFAGEDSVTAQIRTARMECAVRLLQDPAWSSQPVAAVAQRCGFLDHSQFSRAFRQHTGSSPSAFRS